MARITAVPQIHPVFNELDEFGILLGLPRLEEERNAEYKQRLLDVMVHRANSTRLGLIYGITRELGLPLQRAIHLEVHTDVNGVPVLPAPAIVFEDPYCYIYSDYGTGDLIATLDRFNPVSGCYTLGDIVEAINDTGYFTAVLDDDVDEEHRAMTIFDQTSAGIITGEDLAKGSHRIQLEHGHLIEESIAVRGDNLVRRVYSENEIINDGDFYIDTFGGTFESSVVPAQGSAIRYTYLNMNLYFMASPVILHDLNNELFRERLFRKNSVGELGMPTLYGADIINELLSVYPTTWGK